MINQLKSKFFQLVESYLFISVISILAGIIWAVQFQNIAFLATPMLQIIFFLSSLKINLDDIKNALKDVKGLIIVNAFMMIVLPLIFYFLGLAIIPSLAIAFMLLAAMPSGMTTPLLTEIVDGNVNYSLVLTVTTSLLAPITIPLVIKVLVGTAVELSFTAMFLKLAYVIIVPFFLAQIIKRYFHAPIKKSYFTFKPISLILLGLLIAVLVSKHANEVLQDLNMFVFYLIAMIIFYIIIHIMGYYLTFWQSKKDRLTVTVSVTYMNFVLAIYIAGIYFDSAEVVLPLIIQIAPWALMLIPFQKLLQFFNKKA